MPRPTHTRTLAAALAAAAASAALWHRHRARRRVRRLASVLAARGYVDVAASAPRPGAFRAYLGLLAAGWRTASSTFDLARPETWPVPTSGRAHAFTRRTSAAVGAAVEYDCRVWQSAEAQALAVAYLDPRLDGRVHFGAHTSWWVRWLVGRPLWPARRGGVVLDGEDNSWGTSSPPPVSPRSPPAALPLGITVFPTPGAVGGAPTPGHCHLDGGRDGTFATPPLPEPYRLAADQLLIGKSGPCRGCPATSPRPSIAFQCVTPGDCTAARGMTAFYPGSHLAVAEAVRSAARPTFADLLARAKRAPDAVPGLAPVAPTLREGRVRIAAGQLLHGTTYAAEAMGGFPRVMMNAKCFVAQAGRAGFSRGALPRDSLLRRAVEAPSSLVSSGGVVHDALVGHLLGFTEH